MRLMSKTREPKITLGDSIFGLCLAVFLTILLFMVLFWLFPVDDASFFVIGFPFVISIFYLFAQNFIQNTKIDRDKAEKLGTWEVR